MSAGLVQWARDGQVERVLDVLKQDNRNGVLVEALFAAIAPGHVRVVDALMGSLGSRPVGVAGALCLAASNGYADVVARLSGSFRRGGKALNDALVVAARRNHGKVVLVLVEAGADMEFDGWMAARVSLEGGHIELASRLFHADDVLGIWRAALSSGQWHAVAHLMPKVPMSAWHEMRPRLAECSDELRAEVPEVMVLLEGCDRLKIWTWAPGSVSCTSRGM